MDLYVRFDRPLESAEVDRARALVVRRGEGVPVAYLVGEREFWSLKFAVDARVLVPRPETEVLVETLLDALAGRPEATFADVGTGSGCVAVAALAERTDLAALATDLSPEAIEVARSNASRHGVLARMETFVGDLLEPLRPHPLFGRLAAVASNPPYVARGDPTLAEDVRRHEPSLALFPPDDDPLHFVARLAREAREALAPGGMLAVEVGFGQAEGARALLEAEGWQGVAARPDLAGIPRVVLGRTPGS